MLIRCSGDVVSSSNSLSKPVCPLLRCIEDWVDRVSVWAISPPRPPVQRLGQGFLVPRRYGISADAREVFNLLGAVTIAIDHYLQGQPAGMNLGAIAKVRTAAHHRLLSLSPVLDLQDVTIFSPYIYEAC